MMMIHEITEQAGRYKARKRIGRGKGSGTGKRSGRGQKGAGARSGNSQRYSFEGGQMPYFRRLPKMGFSNAKFRSEFWIVNLGRHPQARVVRQGRHCQRRVSHCRRSCARHQP